MTELCKGRVVLSRAGHDKESFLAVLEILPDGFLLLVDGKERPLSNPKRKNKKHVTATHKTVQVDGVSDRALRRQLAELRAAQSNVTER